MRRLLLRFGDRLVLTAASVALGLHGLDTPEEFWADHGYVAGIALGATALFGLAKPLDRLADRDRSLERERAWKRGIEALDQIHMATGLDIRELAIHVWVVRRTLAHPWSGQLTRPFSVRLGHTGANRAMTFVKGKGVVGRCWETNNPVEVDYQATPNPMGLTPEEYEQTKHLRAILAVPIRAGKQGRFVGCVSVDCTAGTLGDLKKAFPAANAYAAHLADLDLERVVA